MLHLLVDSAERREGMSEWRKVKLGDLYTVHNGLSKSKDFFGSGYPFFDFFECV